MSREIRALKQYPLMTEEVWRLWKQCQSRASCFIGSAKQLETKALRFGVVASSIFLLFGTPDETHTLVFDILLQRFSLGNHRKPTFHCISNLVVGNVWDTFKSHFTRIGWNILGSYLKNEKLYLAHDCRRTFVKWLNIHWNCIHRARNCYGNPSLPAKGSLSTDKSLSVDHLEPTNLTK